MVVEVAGLFGALSLFLLLWAQRVWEARSWPAWERLDSALAHDADWMRASFARRAAVIAAFLQAVEDCCLDGETSAAKSFSTQAREQVELHARDSIESLREWADEARALSALLPLAPLRPGDMSLGRLRALTLAWRACHRIAVTSRERYLLRLLVLRWAFASLTQWWRGVSLPHPGAPRWDAARTLYAELHSLGEACADSYEALLVSRQAMAPSGHADHTARARS